MADFDKGIDFRELIPKLKEHWSTDNIDQWISLEGNFDHLVGYARLFWPDFLEHEDCVFRRDHFTEANFLGFMKQTNGDKTAVEVVMNHEHVLDIFPNADPKPSCKMVLYVGRMMKEIWQAKLNRDFPNRKILVSFPEEHSEDLLYYEVTFFQQR